MNKGPNDYTCWNKKCAGKCEPKNGGREGDIIGRIIKPGDKWCYMKGGSDNYGDFPRKCDPTLGCGAPHDSKLGCITKDYDEGSGGCTEGKTY